MNYGIKGLFLIMLLVAGNAYADSTLFPQTYNDQSNKKLTNEIKQGLQENKKIPISITIQASPVNTKNDNSQINKTGSGKFYDWGISFLHKLISDPNVFFSFFVMIFTGILAWVSIYQGRQQANALQLARDEFIATHRPHIRIRRIDSLIITPGKPITAKLEASNIGITEAHIMQMSIDIFFRDKGNPMTAKFNAVLKDVNFPIIPPGKSAIMEFHGAYVATPEDIANFNSRKSELCALGIINYQDIRNIMRSTSFFRIYNDSGARFFPAPDDANQGDREYED